MLSAIWWPPCGTQRFSDQPAAFHRCSRALEFDESIRQRRIELQPVAIGAHPAVAQQIARVLVAEEVFARGHRAGIELGERGL